MLSLAYMGFRFVLLSLSILIITTILNPQHHLTDPEDALCYPALNPSIQASSRRIASVLFPLWATKGRCLCLIWIYRASYISPIVVH